jgi:hypothetical protein
VLYALVPIHGPLCGMPDGTTQSAQVATNSAAPAAERQNKTPIYVSGVKDTRGFLTWLRASFHSGLSAQIKGEKLMLVPRTAEGFRATVSALRSFDGSKGVSFHTLTLPEDRCARLLVRNLGRHMPVGVVREELENLGICVQGVLQLCSGRRDQEAAKARPLTPHFIVSLARGPNVVKLRSLTELWGLRVRSRRTSPRKDPCNGSAANASAIRSGTAATPPGVLLVVRLTFQGSAPTPAAAQVLQLWKKPHIQLPGLCEMEGGQGGACKEVACRKQ